MSDTLVLYQSKYGSAKQYAEWIAEDIHADLQALSANSGANWRDYRVVVFCGGVYANTINGIKIIMKHYDALNAKKLVIVACGLSNPASGKSVKRVSKGLYRQFPQMAGNARLFLVQGGVHYERMRFFDKLVMKFLKKSIRLKKPETLNAEERQMLAVLDKDVDMTDRAAVRPIVAYCGEPVTTAPSRSVDE